MTPRGIVLLLNACAMHRFMVFASDYLWKRFGIRATSARRMQEHEGISMATDTEALYKIERNEQESFCTKNNPVGEATGEVGNNNAHMLAVSARACQAHLPERKEHISITRHDSASSFTASSHARRGFDKHQFAIKKARVVISSRRSDCLPPRPDCSCGSPVSTSTLLLQKLQGSIVQRVISSRELFTVK